MARVEFRSPDKALRGKIGDFVFRKTKRGTHMGLAPGMANGDYGLPPRLWPKALQIVVASKGGRKVKLVITGHRAMRSIDGIDLALFDGAPGSRIVIHGRPSVDIGGVDVIISSADGHRIEKGSAAAEDVPGQWLYTTMKAIPAGTDPCIVLKAREKEGNGVFTIVS